MFYVNVPVDISDFHINLIRLTFLSNNLLFTPASSRHGPTFAFILCCLSVNLMNTNQLVSPVVKLQHVVGVSFGCARYNQASVCQKAFGTFCSHETSAAWLDYVCHVSFICDVIYMCTQCHICDLLSVLQNLTKVSKLEYISYYWLSYDWG